MKTNIQAQPANLLERMKKGVFVASALALVACGGGGGGGESGASDTASNAPQSPASESSPASNNSEVYTPNSERLLEAAADSSGLYVDQDFSFDHTQMTVLDVRLFDDAGAALSSARLSVYLIDTRALDEVPSEWTDALLVNRQLIASGVSDANGLFTRSIEFPRLDDQNPLLLVEVNAVGIETKQIVPVDSDSTVVTLGLI